MQMFRKPLKDVDEAVSSRQKSAKKRSLYVINEHFKPIFNAEMATQVVFQRFLRCTISFLAEGQYQPISFIPRSNETAHLW